MAGHFAAERTMVLKSAPALPDQLSAGRRFDKAGLMAPREALRSEYQDSGARKTKGDYP